jgi:hypothetical protein
MDMQALQIGTRVGYLRYARRFIATHGYGVVTKIDKRGHVTVQCENGTVRRFNKRGEEVERRDADGSKHDIHYTISCTLRDAADVEARVNKEQAERQNNLRCADLSDKLREHIAGTKNGEGRYCTDIETLKQQLIEIINAA